jgi:DNA primase
LRISDESIREIKARIDIVDVIGDFVQLKKSGSSYKALSPFTNEKTPSFFVSPAKEIYKCFSSGKGGDAINFIMEMEGISYVEALKYLAKKYGIEIETREESEEDIKRQNERESLYIITSFANKFYMGNLWDSKEGQTIGLSYFKERGFNDQIIRKFELGYSLDQWDAFYQEAIKNKYDEASIEKAGLIIKKDEKIYDRFRNRVIFPIHNLTGKPIAFGARILTSDKNKPKYINSPETLIYHKSDILYGLFQARQAIRQKENCYLVEGYTDVIALHLAGVENVVASSGTSLTEGQIRLIKRYTNNITVLFDGDEAGIKASLRGIDMILASGLNVRALIFPDGEDPDSYARKMGPSEFQKYLNSHMKDFISFKAELYARDALKDPIKKAETIREIVQSISKIPDPVLRSIYIKETSAMLKIEESVLIAELNKIFISERNKRRNIPPPPDIELIERSITTQTPESLNKVAESMLLQEKESIRLLINYGLNKIEEEHHLYEFLLKELEDVEFQTPIYNRILGIFRENLKDGHVVDADYFIENAPEDIKKEIINMITQRYEISDNWENKKIYVPKEEELLNRSVYENIIRLKHKIIKKLLEDNMNEIKQLKDEEEIERLQRVNIELNKIKIDLGKKLGIIVGI